MVQIESRNPANGKLVRTYSATTPEEVDAAVESCHAAFLEWRRSSFEQRSQAASAAAAILLSDRDRLGELITAEMGKTVTEAKTEVDKCAWLCEHVAETAARDLAPISIPTDATRSFVTFEPLGVILGVMPWNFPFWQALRFAIPVLAAGNGALLKHASNVPGCALAVEDLLHRSGFPPELFRTLLLPSDAVASVLERPEVRGVSLTGSTPAGRAVAARAGALLKKSLLELGGSDAYVLLDDAELERAAEICAASRLLNAGQSCISAKRFIVTPVNRERFEHLLVDRMAVRRVGDPTCAGTDLGPLARPDLRAELHAQVEASIAGGARLLLGGEIPGGPGAFYPPTVLTDVAPGMPAYSEELFGPVAAIIPARDEADAVRIANDSVFGLGAAVFSSDGERAEKIAAGELEAGNCFVNSLVRSDPRLPFGGVKESGYGREMGTFGIREFVNVKTVYVD